MNKLLMVLLALQLTGCATARTLNAAQPGAPVVYSGTRLDLYAMNGGCCAKDRFGAEADRKSTRLNSSHLGISYAVFCLKKKKKLTAVPTILTKKQQQQKTTTHKLNP